MTSIFVNHGARYKVGESVYVLISLPEQQCAGWAEGRIVSSEVWPNTIASNGEPSPRHWYSVQYHVGQNSAECNSSPSHGNILPREEWARKLIINSGGQWLS